MIQSEKLMERASVA